MQEMALCSIHILYTVIPYNSWFCSSSFCIQMKYQLSKYDRKPCQSEGTQQLQILSVLFCKYVFRCKLKINSFASEDCGYKNISLTSNVMIQII